MTWAISELIENFEKHCKTKHKLELTDNDKKLLDNVLCGLRTTHNLGERHRFILDLLSDYANERNRISSRKRRILVPVVHEKRKKNT